MKNITVYFTVNQYGKESVKNIDLTVDEDVKNILTKKRGAGIVLYSILRERCRLMGYDFGDIAEIKEGGKCLYRKEKAQ